MINHIENYLDWLRKNMKEEVIKKGLVEITMPFWDRHNDYIQIYLQTIADGRSRVTDLGYTVDDLEMCGVDITTGKRYEILRRTLNVMGAQFDNKSKELYIECDGSKLAEAQHALIQCMLDVNDLFYLSSESVFNIFYEDVKKYFSESKIFYTPDIKITGRSGLNHHFPFVLQENTNQPERLVRISSNLTRAEAERFMFVWDDIYKMRPKSNLIILVNDTAKVNKNLMTGMTRFNSSIVPVRWSERDEKKNLFA